MSASDLSSNHAAERIVPGILPGILFVGLGSLAIIVFSPYRPLLSGAYDLAGRIGLLLLLLAAALWARRSRRLRPYGPLLSGLFILAAAVSLDWWAARVLPAVLGENVRTPAGFALEKLKTMLVFGGVVLLLTRLFEGSPGSVYVQKGNLKAGLTIGLVAFGISAAGAVPMSQLLFQGRAVTPAQLLAWTPWVLVFVLANAASEELLFRGLFLRKLEPFYGKFFSNCLVVLVFTGLHLGVTYPRDQLLFVVILLPLGLAWGYITQKTEGLWGSILFHAGTDIPVILSILSAL